MPLIGAHLENAPPPASLKAHNSCEETKGRKTELHYAAYTHQLGRVVTRYGPYPDQEKEKQSRHRRSDTVSTVLY